MLWSSVLKNGYNHPYTSFRSGPSGRTLGTAATAYDVSTGGSPTIDNTRHGAAVGAILGTFPNCQSYRVSISHGSQETEKHT
jgi:hypothetical protein